MSVTVVVPTYNRSAFLPELIAALKAQTHPHFRVVLVDDGSSDDTSDVLHREVGDDPRFDVMATPNRGPATARNLASRDTCTEWLAFTDDDCLPQPGWLRSLVAAGELNAADVVQGSTVPDPRVPRREVPWHSRSQSIRAWSGRFQTCNLLVRSSQFRAVGGFNETFPHPWGEDTDLGLRLTRQGARTGFAPDAVVHHRVLPMSYLEYVRRQYRFSQTVHLVAVNPDARGVFRHPYVAYRADVAFWAALPVGVWALHSRRWAVLAAGVVAYGMVQGAKSDKGRGRLASTLWGITELPALAARSMGFLVESVRHGRLVL